MGAEIKGQGGKLEHFNTAHVIPSALVSIDMWEAHLHLGEIYI